MDSKELEVGLLNITPLKTLSSEHVSSFCGITQFIFVLFPNYINFISINPRPTKGGVTVTPSDFPPVALKRRKITQKKKTFR